MSTIASHKERSTSVATLGTLAVALAILATSLGTKTLEWPLDLLAIIAILVVAIAVGATTFVALSNGGYDRDDEE